MREYGFGHAIRPTRRSVTWPCTLSSARARDDHRGTLVERGARDDHRPDRRGAPQSAMPPSGEPSAWAGLRARGSAVTCFVRSPDKLPADVAGDANVAVVQGTTATLTAAHLAGHDVIVSSLGGDNRAAGYAKIVEAALGGGALVRARRLWTTTASRWTASCCYAAATRPRLVC